MPTENIHPNAVVSDRADIHPTATIGPFAVVEDDVQIGAGTTLASHAVVRRFTRIGENNVVDPGAVIGGLPQHSGYKGAETWTVIGNNNVIREGVTINRAYEPGATTRVGDNCFFMANSHVGHDCLVGDNVVMTNGAVLGGHVEVGRNVVMGGYAGAHQFVRIGAFCMVAAMVALRKDALPFTVIGGEPVRHFRLNTIGLRRNGIDKDHYRALESAFRALRDGDRALEGVTDEYSADNEEIAYLLDWLAVKSKYGCYGFAHPK